jgi:hypothetical protein
VTTGCETIDRAHGHYTIITSDSHAGGSHAAYREYLDPKYRDDFDAWRGKYRNPYKDLGDQRRFRNWDNEMRNGQLESDGIVGELIFPASHAERFGPTVEELAQPLDILPDHPNEALLRAAQPA